MQVSGEWQLGRKWTAYWQGIYGKGVAGYIQDIAGTGLDLVPVTGDPGKLQAVEAGSWIGGLPIRIQQEVDGHGGLQRRSR